jgi:peptidoglycan/LPS O-acetylase OafA/YrhL
MDYSRPLDGLRGIAILLVLLFHYNFIVEVGWVGVQLFFVLSGFLITSILLRERDNPLDFYLKRFYWRRTLRIFPLYYAYLALIGAVYVVAHMPAEYADYLPYLATYTFNFYPLIQTYSYEDYFFMHFWSLSVEEQFYLVWPLVIFLCSRKQLKTILIAIIIGAPIVRFALAELLATKGYDAHYLGETVYRFTLGQWDGFAFGALIPVFGLKVTSQKAAQWWLIVFAALIGFGALNGFTITSLGYKIASLVNYQHVWSYTLFDLLFFLSILYVVSYTASNKNIVIKTLESNWLVFAGKISYGLYVYHWIIWMTFNKYVRHYFPFDIIGFIVYLMVCVTVATVSFYLFERPILSLKDKFFSAPKPAYK